MPASPKSRRSGATPGLSALFAAIALLLTLDVATAWRSVTLSQRVASPGGYELGLRSGCVWVGWSDGGIADRRVHVLPAEPRVWFNAYARYSISGALNWSETHVPLWYAWLPLTLTAAGVCLLRPRSRRRRGLCPHCAYPRAGLACDTPCPECGREP